MTSASIQLKSFPLYKSLFTSLPRTNVLVRLVEMWHKTKNSNLKLKCKIKRKNMKINASTNRSLDSTTHELLAARWAVVHVLETSWTRESFRTSKWRRIWFIAREFSVWSGIAPSKISIWNLILVLRFEIPSSARFPFRSVHNVLLSGRFLVEFWRNLSKCFQWSSSLYAERCYAKLNFQRWTSSNAFVRSRCQG